MNHEKVKLEPAPELDVLDLARYDAAHKADPQEQRYLEWTGNRNNNQDAAADMVAYLESRPYKDENGKIVDPQANNETTDNQTPAEDYVEEYGHTDYSHMDETEINASIRKAAKSGDLNKLKDLSESLAKKNKKSTETEPETDNKETKPDKKSEKPEDLSKKPEPEAEPEPVDDAEDEEDQEDETDDKDDDPSEGPKHPGEDPRLVPTWERHDRGEKGAWSEDLEDRLDAASNVVGYDARRNLNHESDVKDLDDVPEKDEELNPTAEYPKIEVDPEMEALLEDVKKARENFVKISAGRRGIVFSRKFSEETLQEAKEAYDEARNKAGAEVAKRLAEADASAKQIREFALTSMASELEALSRDIVEERKNIAGNSKLKGFYEWWGKQGTKFLSVGTLKKAGVMAGIGLVVGIPAGLAGVALIGPAAGAGLGALLGRGLARGVISSHINRSADIYRIGSKDSAPEASASGKAYVDSLGETEDLGTHQISDVVNGRTNEIVRGNRRRAISTTLAGLAIGAVGVAGGDAIAHYAFGGNATHNVVDHQPSHTPETPPVGGETTPGINAQPYEAYQGQVPWDYYANTYGAGRATPLIEQLTAKAQEAGWKVNPLSSGKGILSMVQPGTGEVYDTTPQIIAALQSFEPAS